MKVHQLFENTDLKPLSDFWKSSVVSNLADMVDGVEDGDLLAGIIRRSVAKNAADNPVALFNLVKPVIDFARNAQRERIDTGNMLHGAVINFANELVTALLKTPNPPIKELTQKIDLKSLASYVNRKEMVDLKLLANKAARTPDQEKYDEEQQLYVFIGRPTFVEKGDGSYRKTLEIERLVPVDRFDKKAHHTISMMKLRAQYQGEKSDVFMVHLPKALNVDTDHPDEWLVDLIDEHKQRVAG